MSSITIEVSENFKAGRANYSSEGCTFTFKPSIDGDITINQMRALTAVLQYEAHLSVLKAQVLSGDLMEEQVPALMQKHKEFRDAALRKVGLSNVDGQSTITSLFGHE